MCDGAQLYCLRASTCASALERWMRKIARMLTLEFRWMVARGSSGLFAGLPRRTTSTRRMRLSPREARRCRCGCRISTSATLLTGKRVRACTCKKVSVKGQ